MKKKCLVAPNGGSMKDYCIEAAHIKANHRIDKKSNCLREVEKIAREFRHKG